MTMAFFSVPTPQHYHHKVQLYKPKNSWPATTTYPSFCKILVPPSSTPTSLISSSPDEEELDAPIQSELSSKQSGCKACGSQEIEKGCNGEGRMQGGIATVPGFGWWPIKAYRPCPGFVASGGRYRRQGQSMDEVVSGSGKTKAPSPSTATDSKPSSIKEGSKKSKKR
ncbi:uncharacterized protein LOC123915624 [Trifolium pratense]|uniref:uncharacterized protein LOC123915624 n=1 Tax=Trifolium pratense TaxID=57577 RepID=UPI001E694395|nr:uncharacterized protein LOC123915624 [Trifolium pratense]